MHPRRPLSGTLQVFWGLAVLWALTILPSRPAGWGDLLRLPFDVPLATFLLCLVPSNLGRVSAALVMLIAASSAILRLMDLGVFLALQTDFNPLLDWHLLVSAWELAAGTFGLGPTVIAIVSVFLGLAVLLWSGYRGLAQLTRCPRAKSLPIATTALVLSAILWFSFPARIGASILADLPSRTARTLVELKEETNFVLGLKLPETAGPPDFAALSGRDVYVLFVESYGRTWLEKEEFRATARARLKAVEERLTSAGVHAISTWMSSPTRGGQSWLAHGTALSGLWIDGQSRYDALIQSNRNSLNRQFQTAGWTTMAVMPAITRDWPEANWFGYDAVYDQQALGYQGVPFDWVTMPDQYTLSETDKLAQSQDTPVMVEAALISSHAPWTPHPDILPWEQIGDGQIFDGSRRYGDTPAAVWSDPYRVREAYSTSLDYTLEVVGQWIARRDSDALYVVLGDHQPAPIITGPDASAAVPVHFLSRDEKLLAQVSGGWTKGLIPSADLPERPLSDMRDLIGGCLSSEGCPNF